MNYKEYIIAIGLFAIIIFPFNYMDNDLGIDLILKRQWIKMDEDLFVIYEFLRRHEPKSVVVMEDIYHYRHYIKGYYNPLMAFTGDYPIISLERYFNELNVLSDEIEQRIEDIKTFYSTDSSTIYKQILRRYDIAYVIDDDTLHIKDHLRYVIRSGRFTLYKVIDSQR